MSHREDKGSKKKMSSKISEYKGNTVLELLDENDKSDNPVRLSFGKRKANLVLNHIEDIKKFVGEANVEEQD